MGPFGFAVAKFSVNENFTLGESFLDERIGNNQVQYSGPSGSDAQGSLFLTYNLASFIGSLLMAVLCLIGFYGNVVSIAIFGQPPMRSSINVLLSGVSAIDLAVLIFSVPVFVLPTLDQYVKFEFVQKCYSFALLVVYPLAMMARTASVWTFVLITVERYFAVCYPLDMDRTMTPERAKRAQLTVITLSAFYNLIRFWEYGPNLDSKIPPKRSADQVVPLLRGDDHYFVIYYTALYMITNFIFPFFIIITLNTRILSSIRRAYYERCTMNGQQRNRYRTCRMIVVVTVMFGLCNFFSFILSVWELCQPGLFESEIAVYGYLLLDFSNIAIIFNSSTTFVVFLVYCKKYRRFFLWFFRCGCLTRKFKDSQPAHVFNGFSMDHFNGTTVSDHYKQGIVIRNYRSIGMLRVVEANVRLSFNTAVVV